MVFVVILMDVTGFCMVLAAGMKIFVDFVPVDIHDIPKLFLFDVAIHIFHIEADIFPDSLKLTQKILYNSLLIFQSL